MNLGNILKKVVLPVAGKYFLAPGMGKGLSSLGMTKLSGPLITNALASGLGSLAMGDKKDALRLLFKKMALEEQHYKTSLRRL